MTIEWLAFAEWDREGKLRYGTADWRYRCPDCGAESTCYMRCSVCGYRDGGGGVNCVWVNTPGGGVERVFDFADDPLCEPLCLEQAAAG